MQCESCGNAEAVIQFTKVEDSQARVFHLCEGCAAEQGVDVATSPPNAPLADFLAQIGKSMGDEAIAAGRCPSCGLTPAQLKQLGRLGCAQLLRALRAAPAGTAPPPARRHAPRGEGPGDPRRHRDGPQGARAEPAPLPAARGGRRGLRARRRRCGIRSAGWTWWSRKESGRNERRLAGPPSTAWSGSRRMARTPTSSFPPVSGWRATSRTFRFGLRSGEGERDSVLELTRAAAEQSEVLADGSAISMADLKPMSRRLLLERHLVSNELVGEEGADPPRARGAAARLPASRSASW